MRMTPDQILLVQTSFAMTGADGSALARSLTARLATSGSATPAAPLAGLLVLAVRGLSRRRLLRPALQRLATRHQGLRQGVLDAAALVEALEEAFGDRLPRSVVDAWRAWHRLTVDLLRPAHS